MSKRMRERTSSPEPASPSQTSAARKSRRVEDSEVASARRRILAGVSGLRILDPGVARELVRTRQARGLDKSDEMWEGVYVVPPVASNEHQDLATALASILFQVIASDRRGRVEAQANVSDRRAGWENNYRDPDVVVILNEGRAVDCGTHWLGGPDFLLEVQSTGDETDEKIPFYEGIGVRELLIVHRDSRQLRLHRHDGRKMRQVRPSAFLGGKWLVSSVVPLAFRRTAPQGPPRTEVQRTDTESGSWTI